MHAKKWFSFFVSTCYALNGFATWIIGGDFHILNCAVGWNDIEGKCDISLVRIVENDVNSLRHALVRNAFVCV